MEHQGSTLESDYFYHNSKIANLITNITKMSKNPTIESNLSQVLDEFLEKLGECDKYLQNGIFNMNFAEAALVLQSSADLYSKKVDLLWDVIFDYQKRLLLSEEHNGDKEQELEKVEERKRKYKRKRKTNSDESQAATLVNNFSFGQVENFDYLNQPYDTIDLSAEWSKFNSHKQTGNDLNEHIASKKFLFLSNEQVHTENNDYIGRYDQFHSTSLIEEIFHLEEQKLLADDHNCVTEMRIDSYIINDFLLENTIPATTSKDKYIAELNKYINNFLQVHKHPEKEISVSENVLEQLYCKKSVVCLERLPFNVLRDKIRRASVVDSLFGDDMSTVSGQCPSPCNSIRDDHVCETFDQIGGSLENRSKSCSQDSAFYEDGEDQLNNEEGETDVSIAIDGATDTVTEMDIATSIGEDLVEVVAITEVASSPVDEVTDSASISVPPDITEDITPTIAAAITDSLLESPTEKVSVTTKASDSGLLPSIKRKSRKTVNTENTSVVTRHIVGRKWSSLLEDFEDEEVEIKRRKVQKKVSAKVLKKLATGVTAKYRDFEIFCRLHYKAADGEGTIHPYQVDPGDEDENEDDGHMSEDDEEEEEENEAPSPVNTDEGETSDLEETQEEVTPENPCEDQEISLSQPTDPPDLPATLDPVFSPIPSSNLPSCSTSKDTELRTSTPYHSDLPVKNFALSDTDLEQEELCRKNVREWRAFIMPKISTMENKTDFDIHDYGSKIIEPSKIGEERHFKDIVTGKSAAEVARYFIATLQLANASNVEITGAVPGELANDSFKIKILDKTKHHELLEDYQAPSEETFRERLERVKALNPKAPLHSTPKGGPPAKKAKLVVLLNRNFSK